MLDHISKEFGRRNAYEEAFILLAATASMLFLVYTTFYVLGTVLDIGLKVVGMALAAILSALFIYTHRSHAETTWRDKTMILLAISASAIIIIFLGRWYGAFVL